MSYNNSEWHDIGEVESERKDLLNCAAAFANLFNIHTSFATMTDCELAYSHHNYSAIASSEIFFRLKTNSPSIEIIPHALVATVSQYVMESSETYACDAWYFNKLKLVLDNNLTVEWKFPDILCDSKDTCDHFVLQSAQSMCIQRVMKLVDQPPPENNSCCFS